MGFQRNILSVAISAALLNSGYALAQEETPESEEQVSGVERIMVTAQRVEQSMQEVPVAVSAFEGPQLEDANIGTIDDLALRAPGVSTGRFNPAQPQIYIRGIGSTDQSASGDPSVGIFVDGVYITRPGGTDLDFFDLERVEVLRGPQGTLYGKNVVGGAINFITRAPREEFGARAELTVGNYNRRDFRGLVEGAIAENWNAKASINRRDRDGYATSATSGAKLSEEDSIAFRSQLHFIPNDVFNIRFSFDYKQTREIGTNRHCKGEQFIFFPWFAPGSPMAPSPCSADPYTSEKTVDGYTNIDVWGLSATAQYDLGWADLTSVTAFRRSEVDLEDDFSGSDAPFVVRYVIDEADTFSQEFRLSGGDEEFRWLLGYYFLTADIYRMENNDFSGNDAGLGLPPTLSFNPFYYQWNDTTNHALFGQAGIEIAENLTLQLGGRFGYEKKEARIQTDGFDPTGSFLVEAYQTNPSASWSNFSPMASLDYKFSPRVMGYVSYSEGYKSGGFNGTARDLDSAEQGFDEEHARQYELGFKSQLLNNRLRLNASLFYIDYSDLQVFQLVDGASLVVSNAANATSQGIELEAYAMLNENWRLHGSYAYLDATYDTFVNEDGQDFSGNSLTRSPRNSYSIGVNYYRPIGERSAFRFYLDYSYRSQIFFEANNLDLLGDESVGLLNAKAIWEIGTNWEFSVWGRNLTDEVHITNIIDGRGPFNLSQNGSAVIAEPRMFGLSVGYRF